ncbi:glycerate kinase [Chitinophaga caeni]|uniref:Glycerate kinase n=1 Tax=Chitinophaga caeni TaxID=2029983 RepID=A0A291QPG3_9BACT|nr:DUF4147 domain-containing protein [Chitinophaga caeni]ATL45817.1 glycerate kinase [Chitinophaga caeni]
MDDYRKLILELFEDGLKAVQPGEIMPQTIYKQDGQWNIAGNQFPEQQSFYIIGAGKAAAIMALAVEDILGNKIAGGCVITQFQSSRTPKKVRVLLGDHPKPGVQSLAASKDLISYISTVPTGAVVIFLLSGGASSLMADVPDGITLEELSTTFEALLHSGASINEINIVRKHLSKLKGGQLTKLLSPRQCITLAISDVPGDDPAIIGSGPSFPADSTFEDAWQVLERYKLLTGLPTSVIAYLRAGLSRQIPALPAAADAIFENSYYKIIATNKDVIAAIQKSAAQRGWNIGELPFPIGGIAKDFGKKLADFANHYQGKRPACLVTGGESTVEVRGNGKGGRNQELALSASMYLDNNRPITLLAAGTDGKDGPTEAAGAIVDQESASRYLSLQLKPGAYLSDNNAYPILEQTGQLIFTGPTGNNLMDIVIILVAN